MTKPVLVGSALDSVAGGCRVFAHAVDGAASSKAQARQGDQGGSADFRYVFHSKILHYVGATNPLHVNAH